MTKVEFLKMTEIGVSDLTFDLMNDLYMDCDETITKKLFCEQYKKIYEENSNNFEKSLTKELLEILKHDNHFITRYNRKMENQTNNILYEIMRIFIG